jgi:hypothetical protein
VCLDIPEAIGILARRLLTRELSNTRLFLLGAVSRNIEDEHIKMSGSDVYLIYLFSRIPDIVRSDSL